MAGGIRFDRHHQRRGFDAFAYRRLAGGQRQPMFSSIATKDNEKKGLQVGATVQVSKPHYDDLVATVGRVLEEATM